MKKVTITNIERPRLAQAHNVKAEVTNDWTPTLAKVFGLMEHGAGFVPSHAKNPEITYVTEELRVITYHRHGYAYVYKVELQA